MPSVALRISRLDALPNELLVKLICYLEIRDILRLRQTSKFFKELIYSDAVGCSLFATSPPLPRALIRPLPKLHHFAPKSWFCLVQHARSLDDAWNDAELVPDAWSFDAGFRVHEMLLLPGFRHLLAAVTIRKGTERVWGLALYLLTGLRPPLPMLFHRTQSLPYGLTARFNMVATKAKGQKPGALTFAYITNNGPEKDPASCMVEGEEGEALEEDWLRDGLRSYHEQIATEWKANMLGIIVEDLRALDAKYGSTSPDSLALDEHIKNILAPGARTPLIPLMGIYSDSSLTSPQLLHLEDSDPETMVLAVLRGTRLIVQSAWLTAENRRKWTIEFNAGDKNADLMDEIQAFRLVPETKEIVLVTRERGSRSDLTVPFKAEVQLYEIPPELQKTIDDICFDGPLPTRASLSFSTLIHADSEADITTTEANPIWQSEVVHNASSSRMSAKKVTKELSLHKVPVVAKEPDEPVDSVARMPTLTVSISNIPGAPAGSLKRWTVQPRPPHLHVPLDGGSTYEALRYHVPELKLGPRVSHAPGAVPMQNPHYCWDGMARSQARTPTGTTWRFVRSSTNAGRQLVYAVGPAMGRSPPRATGFWRLCESSAGRLEPRRLPVSMPRYEYGVEDYSNLAVAWDDSVGRMCWTFPGSSTIRVVDVIPLVERVYDPSDRAVAAPPTITVSGPAASSSGDLGQSPPVSQCFSKRGSWLTELDFYFWNM